MTVKIVKLLVGLFIFLLSCLCFTKCANNDVYTKKSVFDKYGNHICDSIFENNLVTKVIFKDTLFEVDSIVFTRFNGKGGSLKSKETFSAAKRVFENVYYYPNGKMSNYIFFDDDSEDYYYERQYKMDGQLENINGRLFYQGFVIDSPKTSDAYSIGTKVTYHIYFPSPPDCDSKIYIRNDDGSVYDVFKRSNTVNFLETVSQTLDEKGTFKLKIYLELRDKQKDTMSEYHNEIIYQVK